MNDPAKNILIGLFVVAATAIIIFVMLFLHPTVGDDGQNLKVRFANIDKISVGTRVTYGGKPVGEVIDIKEVDSLKDARKPGKDGYVYVYELILGVDTKVKVYNTDQVSSRTSGLLGEKSVEITPLPAKPGEKIYLVNDQVLFANETGSVEETLKEFKELSDKIEDTLDSLKYAMDDLNRNKLWEKIGKTAQNLSDITTALNEPEKWKQTLDHAVSFMKRLDESSITVQNTVNHFQNVAGNLAAGEGTLGGILVRDDVYLQTRSLLAKAETILDDVNHYGILYQNDKRWQRLRARRANLLMQLSSPQEFRNYFNDELNSINTSLARLSMVLQETEASDQYCCFMFDDEFRKVFAELLRRVTTMEDSLKMYNQQVVECDTYKTELCPERCE